MKSEATSQTRRALLLIDLQNDFVDGGALAVPGGRNVISTANALMSHFDFVIATQDWHPANHQSFASQHPNLAVGDCFQLHGLPQIVWPDHCVQGTFGAEMEASLNQDRIDCVVRKGMNCEIDSYSGFFDNGHQTSTGLSDILKAQQISQVFVMGLATDYCVRFTALDAIAEGFRTALIVDGCRGVDLKPGDIDAAINQMKNAGVQIVFSTEINQERHQDV